MKQHKYIFLAILSALIFNSHAFDRSFFYRASSFWGEPRFERDLLSTFDLQLTGGSTHFDMSKLCQTKKKFCCSNALFSICEINFNYWQNLVCGFFTHFHLPFALINITKNSSHIEKARCVGLSDCSFLLGKTINYQATEDLDFIDLTIQAGVLFPSGKKKITDACIDIPYGYNGHWGFTFICDLSCGYLDWVTAGIHFDGVVLAKEHNTRHTFSLRSVSMTGEENGSRSITKGEAFGGNVWRVGTYGKADHFCAGLSTAIAFTYELQQKPCSWQRAILHFILDYDFASLEYPLGPEINVFYNLTIYGKNIIKTNTVGGNVGFNIAWCF